MTKAELIKALSELGSDEPRSEAKIILEEIFDVSLQEQTLFPEKDYESERLAAIIERRAAHEPLQYIIGHTYFCREKYILNTDCLIPRHDTELLVLKAIELLPAHAHFADLCTGSGCVAISTLCARADTRAIAVDISGSAVAAARDNACINGVSDRIEIFEADIFKNPLGDKKYDAILSNPPYIPTDIVSTLKKEVLCEPCRALDGGADGMDFYRFIIKNCKSNLTDGGFFAFEIGYDQERQIISLAQREGFSCDIFQDIGGNARVAVLFVK